MVGLKTTITEKFGYELNKGNDELLEDYGDKIYQKDDGNIRIGFQNINGINGRINAAHEVFATMEEKEKDTLGFWKQTW